MKKRIQFVKEVKKVVFLALTALTLLFAATATSYAPTYAASNYSCGDAYGAQAYGGTDDCATGSGGSTDTGTKPVGAPNTGVWLAQKDNAILVGSIAVIVIAAGIAIGTFSARRHRSNR